MHEHDSVMEVAVRSLSSSSSSPLRYQQPAVCSLPWERWSLSQSRCLCFHVRSEYVCTGMYVHVQAFGIKDDRLGEEVGVMIHCKKGAPVPSAQASCTAHRLCMTCTRHQVRLLAWA